MTWPAPAVDLRGRSHCKNGHAWTPENTIVRDDGWRRCRECTRLSVGAVERREYMRPYMREYRSKVRG